MKYILLAALVLLPGVSYGATYHYVTSAGFTASVEADSGEMALLIAPNIAWNSGVALDEGLIEEGTKVEGAHPK